MKNLKLLALIFSVAIGSWSCSDDEPAPFQDQAMGTYNYTMTAYELDGGKLYDLNNPDLDGSGTVIVTKTSTGFDVKEGGDLLFKATKLEEASNGFTFDIATQTITSGSSSLTIEGYDGVELEGVDYHGLFEKASKKLTGYFQTDVIFADSDGDQYQGVLVWRLVATKV